MRRPQKDCFQFCRFEFISDYFSAPAVPIDDIKFSSLLRKSMILSLNCPTRQSGNRFDERMIRVHRIQCRLQAIPVHLTLTHHWLLKEEKEKETDRPTTFILSHSSLLVSSSLVHQWNSTTIIVNRTAMIRFQFMPTKSVLLPCVDISCFRFLISMAWPPARVRRKCRNILTDHLLRR